MGTYTEFRCVIKLKKDTPENVVAFLNRVLVLGDLGHDKILFDTEDVFVPEFDHEFFKCERWYMLFLSTNWSDISGGNMYEKNGYNVIDIHTEFKDYGSEIEKFIDWITPFVLGRKKKQYIGYYRSEHSDNSTNIYIER